jgi:hypothetical protein
LVGIEPTNAIQMALGLKKYSVQKKQISFGLAKKKFPK